MFVEKLRSLLKFGPASTRYKDIFDMYYLMTYIHRDQLQVCLDSYIYHDGGMRENNMNDIINRVKMTFYTKIYQKRIRTSDKKWVDGNIEDIFKDIINFLESLIYVES